MTVEVFIKGYYLAPADLLFDQATRLPDTENETEGGSDRIRRFKQGHVYGADLFSPGLYRLQRVRVRIDRICHAARIVETTECNSLARCWRHKQHVKQTQNGAVWTDRLLIDAGVMTPLIARYAAFVHKKRHKAQGATAIETFMAKSYRATVNGLPIFQTVD